MSISSKKTAANFRKKGLRMAFMAAWNVYGVLQRPKGMTRYS